MKPGDIFAIPINQKVFYMQYIVDDMTQLNSAVVRVFKTPYPPTEAINFEMVVSDETLFHAHVNLRLGKKLKLWEKVGKATIYPRDVLFRDSSDYGTPSIKVSNNWWIWKINEPQRNVGKLEGENTKAEIGIIVTPHSLVERIVEGKYKFVYPEFNYLT